MSQIQIVNFCEKEAKEVATIRATFHKDKYENNNQFTKVFQC